MVEWPGDYKRQAIESVADRVHFLYRLPLGSRKSTLLFTPMCVSELETKQPACTFCATVHNPFPAKRNFAISYKYVRYLRQRFAKVFETIITHKNFYMLHYIYIYAYYIHVNILLFICILLTR